MRLAWVPTAVLVGLGLSQSGCADRNVGGDTTGDGATTDAWTGACLSPPDTWDPYTSDTYTGPCLGQETWTGPCLSPETTSSWDSSDTWSTTSGSTWDTTTSVCLGPVTTTDTLPPTTTTPGTTTPETTTGPCLGVTTGGGGGTTTPADGPGGEPRKRDWAAVLEGVVQSGSLPDDVIERLRSKRGKPT